MTVWFTSDQHFGHKKILDYSDRPFRSLRHMHRVIIKNHNNLVSKDDTVIVVGDFCFSSKKYHFKKLQLIWLLIVNLLQLKNLI